ncbi:FAD:protein FMN transferase [Candidatus Saccharibacteria bacterium]|nr:FAD:protein FMN transferase [Candidatus Saccharibacteria bacterium]
MKPLTASYKFEAIGTQWELATHNPLGSQTKQLIAQCIEDFDFAYSRFRPDSLVSQLHKQPLDGVSFPDSIKPIYDIYQQLEILSDGKINPLVGTRLDELGYGQDYTLRPKSTLSKIPLFTQTSNLQNNHLKLSQPLILDIGAVGKGLLVDNICKIVANYNQSFIVDGSGDIYIRTDEAQIIGLENPLDTSKVIGTVSITDLSICASANNRRIWNNYQHIIDATNMDNNCNIVATWAITSSTFLADALSTALFFVPPDKLMKHFGNFNYVTIDKDQNIAHNINKIGEIFV